MLLFLPMELFQAMGVGKGSNVAINAKSENVIPVLDQGVFADKDVLIIILNVVKI